MAENGGRFSPTSGLEFSPEAVSFCQELDALLKTIPRLEEQPGSTIYGVRTEGGSEQQICVDKGVLLSQLKQRAFDLVTGLQELGHEETVHDILEKNNIEDSRQQREQSCLVSYTA